MATAAPPPPLSDILPYFSTLENDYGLPDNYLTGAYGIESGYGSNTGVSSAGASGPFQFIPSTAASYGLTNRGDLHQSAQAAAALAADNVNSLRNALGREPTAGELYLAHQQGAEGAIALLTHPDQIAANTVGYQRVAQNLPPGMRPQAGTMTGADFANYWTNRFTQLAQPGAAQDATVAALGTSTPDAALAYASQPPAPPPPAPPPVDATVPAGPLGASDVVRASTAGDPTHITDAWNHMISSVMGAGQEGIKKVTDYFSGLPSQVAAAAAVPFAWKPELWNSIPAMVPGRDAMKVGAEDAITGGAPTRAMQSLGLGPSMATIAPAGEYSTPVYDNTPPPAAPSSVAQGGPMAGVDMAAPTKDPLQAVNASMATSAPPAPVQAGDYAAGASSFTPASAQDAMQYAMASVTPPAASPPPTAPMTPSAPPPVAKPPTMATTAPSKGIGAKIYSAIAQPITQGSKSFWSGPMTQPFFNAISGGATMPYQRDTGMTTTDVRGDQVNIGVYNDENGNQHQYTWSPSGAP